MEFEWELEKAASNLKKHGVTFQEAATVFGGALAITFDPDHSMEDRRFLTFGLSKTGKLLVVSHTEKKRRHENHQRPPHDETRETDI